MVPSKGRSSPPTLMIVGMDLHQRSTTKTFCMYICIYIYIYIIHTCCLFVFLDHKDLVRTRVVATMYAAKVGMITIKPMR